MDGAFIQTLADYLVQAKIVEAAAVVYSEDGD
jgi:hypothetical protein